MKQLASKLLSSVSLFIFAGQLAGSDTIDFGEEVYPILKESCLRCHAAPYEDSRGRTKKPKGGLRLDTPHWIMEGYLNDEDVLEPIVIPGDPDASELYTLTILPEDHDDVMPTSGDLLSKEKSDTLKRWIKEGAKFGDFEAPKYVNPKSKEASLD